VIWSYSEHCYERVWNENYHFVKNDRNWASCVRQPCPHRLNGYTEEISDESLIPIELQQAKLIIAVGRLLSASIMSTHPNSPASVALQSRAASAAPIFGNVFSEPVPMKELDAHAAISTQVPGLPLLADLTQLM
jgi:hypothetical protein